MGWKVSQTILSCAMSKSSIKNQNGLVSKYYVSSVKTVGPMNFVDL